MNFRRRKKCGPIGLDIGSSGVKLLQLSSELGQPTVVAAAHAEFPSEIPQSTDMNELVERAVADCLRRGPFEGREVVTAFGNGEFQLKNVRLPRMPSEELAAAVEFEASERFDFSRSSAQVRFIPVGEVRHGNEIKEEVIVFAAPDDAVTSRLAVLENLKLSPVAIDLTPCAVARSFVRFLRRSEDVNAINVFLDVGFSGTNVVITRGSEINFIKQVEVGGRHLVDAVAKALSISLQEAADLRLRIMREGGGRRDDDQTTVPEDIRAALKDAVKPLIERLSRDVQMCLRYFAVTFRGQRPDSLTLVGGEAYEPILAPTLTQAFNVPCMVGHPMRGIGRLGDLGGRDRRTMQPAWATACGLALRGSAWVRTGSRIADRSIGGDITAKAVV